MKWNKIAASLLMAVLMLCTMALPAMAVAPSIDVNHLGSLNVQILETGTTKGVPGGKVEIYQLSSVALNPYRGYYHAVCPAFASVLTNAELQDLESMTAAQKDDLIARVSAYIAQEHLSSDAQAVPNAQGVAKFSGRSLGLYLVVQTKAASRYTAIAPFLITLPQYKEDNTEVIYNVDAAPKVGTVAPIPTPTPTPTPSHPPVTPSVLPKTGQLWWPVYALTGAGMVMFLAGWLRRKRGANEE